MRQSILFLTPYPCGTAASQRFRFEQYYDLLEQNGYSITVKSFLDKRTWTLLYQPSHYPRKILGIILGFIRRIVVLAKLNKFDFVFIHREAAPIGPPLIEWIIIKIFKKKVIFDFDDAIWINNTSRQNRVVRQLRFPAKIRFMIKSAYKVSVANGMLSQFASAFNSKVIINPTTLDTELHHNKLKDHTAKRPVIGWTGTHSTLQYLDIIIPIFKELRTTHEFDIIIISDQDPVLKDLDYQFVKWCHDTEIDDLLKMDIGIMPLSDDLWSQGKSGFKAMQYMALGIPAVVSNVGVNANLVEDGVSGYLCNNQNEWEEALIKLMSSPQLRSALGIKGREFVEKNFSVKSNAKNFLSIFF
jgi:glycosyltransferase involved in cell wall biosynthesis